MLIQKTNEAALSLKGHLSTRWYSEGHYVSANAPTKYLRAVAKWILDILKMVNDEDLESASRAKKILLDASLQAKPWTTIVK